MWDGGKKAFKKLRILLDRMMLRYAKAKSITCTCNSYFFPFSRTKVERADDLGLPPRTVIVRRDFFSDEEKELYLSLFKDVRRQFS